MKKSTFTLTLALTGLLLTTIPASAAMPGDSETVALPEFRTSVARYTEAEKSIHRSLAAFQARVSEAAPLVTELPSLGTCVAKTDADQGKSVAAKPARSPAGVPRS
jgi:hypothetical protein